MRKAGGTDAIPDAAPQVVLLREMVLLERIDCDLSLTKGEFCGLQRYDSVFRSRLLLVSLVG